MTKEYTKILSKIVNVLSDEEYASLENELKKGDEFQNQGVPLTKEEKQMLDNLKKTVSAEDIKTLSNGKTDLSYLSWAQISKSLTECLGKENWYMTDLDESSVTRAPNNSGYFVHVTISLFRGKIIEIMSLPVMDGANKPIKDASYKYQTKYGEKTVEALDSFNLYKNYQRCFVKAVAVATGLGIELYTGEDLPEIDDKENTPTEKKTPAKKDSASKKETITSKKEATTSKKETTAKSNSTKDAKQESAKEDFDEEAPF